MHSTHVFTPVASLIRGKASNRHGATFSSLTDHATPTPCTCPSHPRVPTRASCCSHAGPSPRLLCRTSSLDARATSFDSASSVHAHQIKTIIIYARIRDSPRPLSAFPFFSVPLFPFPFHSLPRPLFRFPFPPPLAPFPLFLATAPSAVHSAALSSPSASINTSPPPLPTAVQAPPIAGLPPPTRHASRERAQHTHGPRHSHCHSHRHRLRKNYRSPFSLSFLPFI